MPDEINKRTELNYAPRGSRLSGFVRARHVGALGGAALGVAASLLLSYPFSEFPSIWRKSDPFPLGKYLRFGLHAIWQWLTYGYGNPNRLDDRFEGPFIKEWLPFGGVGLLIGCAVGWWLGLAWERRRAKRRTESQQTQGN